MGPLKLYQKYIADGKISEDPAQIEIVQELEQIYQLLLSKNDFLSLAKISLFRSLGLRQVPVKGLYLWGSVGRGKTFLIDLFYSTIPFSQKTRLHFHHFMLYVHHALTRHQGVKDPLKLIAKEFAEQYWVLCFDEFYVKDIADAMILTELFEQLFHHGVTLLATSNLAPQALYANGLQREKFIPTIDLIHQHTHVIEIQGQDDYRLKHLSHALYYYPLDEHANRALLDCFNQLAPVERAQSKELVINDRTIKTVFCSPSVAWFSFEALCKSARSTPDYIEIARSFKTIIVSNVEVMSEDKEDIALRFISMVDEFYERHVTLILSAQEPFTLLYQGKRHSFEFQRTISRLTEMQSAEYIAKPHLQ